MLLCHIKDLYYSLYSNLLLSSIRGILQLNLVSLQAQAGISVDVLLRLLKCYLRSIVVKFNKESFVQHKGGIGSAVAPLLSEFDLNVLKRQVPYFVEHLGVGSVIVS